MLLQMIAVEAWIFSLTATTPIILLSLTHLNLEPIIDAVACHPDPISPL